MYGSNKGSPHFFMTELQLKQALRELREEGFDESFARYCASTFSSHTYPAQKLGAARMHAFFLRCFLDAYLSGDFSWEGEPEGIDGTVLTVGRRSVDETLTMDSPTATAFCRAFVRIWCETLSTRG